MLRGGRRWHAVCLLQGYIRATLESQHHDRLASTFLNFLELPQSAGDAVQRRGTVSTTAAGVRVVS